MVSNLYHARLKTFKRLTIFLTLMFLAMFIFNIINIEDKFIAVISVLVVCVFIVVQLSRQKSKVFIMN